MLLLLCEQNYAAVKIKEKKNVRKCLSYLTGPGTEVSKRF